MRLPSIKKLGLGYSFGQDREVLSLIYLCYFFILLFSVVVILLHSSDEELVPVSYRYHAMILFSFAVLLLVRFRLIILAKLLTISVFPFALLMLRQQDELIQAEKMASLGVMTTGIAHEINNPMNFISGGLHATHTLKNELLNLDGKPSGEKQALYEQMDKIMENTLEGVERVTDIVTSLNFFSKPGKAYKTDHDLQQLLYSVLSPIPEHEIKLIYDPFYTLGNMGSGKGLGMAISYMIMQAHQGWIEARNENDLVIFDLFLPKN